MVRVRLFRYGGDQAEFLEVASAAVAKEIAGEPDVFVDEIVMPYGTWVRTVEDDHWHMRGES